MDVPSVYAESSEEIKKIIVSLGVSCYLKLFQNMNNEEILMKYANTNKNILSDVLEKEIDILKRTIDDNNIIHQNEIKHNTHKINLLKQNEIESLEDTIIILKKEKENEINERIRSEKNHHAEHLLSHKNLFESHSLNYENMISSLKEKNTLLEKENEKQDQYLKTWVGKRDFKNNTEQGIDGEKMIDNVVNKGLNFDKKATVEDSSQKGGSGDRIITFSNSDKCMVEVKNKGVITKEDMDQFTNHYKCDFAEKKCQIALLVSLQTNQIPKIGNSTKLFYKDNVGYFGLKNNLTIEEKEERIEDALQELTERYNDTKTNIKKEDIVGSDIYNEILKIRLSNKEESENKVKKYTKKLEISQKTLTECKQLLNDLYRKIQKNHIIIDERLIDEKVYIEELINEIKLWIANENMVLKKQTFKKIIIDKMNLSELDHKFIHKKIKLTDLY